VVPHRFGRSWAFSLGLEEELFVVDGESLEPAPVPPGLLDGKRFKAELFTSMLELTTSVCRDVGEAVDELASLRSAAREHVREQGLELAAVGTWPTAVAEEQEVTEQEGLLAFAEYAGPSARRQHCAGLHVHVGVASPQECMGRLEAVLPWLPVVLAVSANSPYVGGAETGMASTRAELLALLPRAGAPPAFASYEDWARFAESLVELGLADDLMRLWWDVRPHPRLGTLEIRMPDQPSRLVATAGFAALGQALVASVEPSASACDRGVYLQNRWAASRFGHRAELIHPENGRLCGTEELLAELLERVDASSRSLGSAGFLVELQGLAQAADQLALGAADGLGPLCRRLVALTYDDV
jgi:glutamate---cysteine ligase / carboxylate-amine ligase